MALYIQMTIEGEVVEIKLQLIHKSKKIVIFLSFPHLVNKAGF